MTEQSEGAMTVAATKTDVESKLQFLSDDWFRYLREVTTEAVHREAAALRDADYCICEVFTECPGGGGRAHWIRVKAGEITFGDGIAEFPDTKLVIDYATCLRLSRTVNGPELAEAARTATEAGKMRREGVDGPRPEALATAFQRVHDAVARMTA